VPLVQLVASDIFATCGDFGATSSAGGIAIFATCGDFGATSAAGS